MRHGVKLNHLGRTASHRHALLSGLACELFLNKRINTTLAKARALRVYAEPLITKSKTNTTHQRRVVFSYLNDKDAVKELFANISAKVADRPGGYTRIIKLGTRLGDAAEMAMIELVDYNEIYTKEAQGGRKKRTRRSGGTRKKAAGAPAEAEAPEAAAQGSSSSESAAEEPAEGSAEEQKDKDEKEGRS